MKVYYIGMDVHKKNISYCIKTKSGGIVSQGNIASNRASLRQWAIKLPRRWIGAMEATLFAGCPILLLCTMSLLILTLP